MANLAFGTVLSGTVYDPELISGWGKRGFNWEFAAGVQHELMPRVALDVAFISGAGSATSRRPTTGH